MDEWKGSKPIGLLESKTRLYCSKPSLETNNTNGHRLARLLLFPRGKSNTDIYGSAVCCVCCFFPGEKATVESASSREYVLPRKQKNYNVPFLAGANGAGQELSFP